MGEHGPPQPAWDQAYAYPPALPALLPAGLLPNEGLPAAARRRAVRGSQPRVCAVRCWGVQLLGAVHARAGPAMQCTPMGSSTIHGRSRACRQPERTRCCLLPSPDAPFRAVAHHAPTGCRCTTACTRSSSCSSMRCTTGSGSCAAWPSTPRPAATADSFMPSWPARWVLVGWVGGLWCGRAGVPSSIHAMFCCVSQAGSPVKQESLH